MKITFEIIPLQALIRQQHHIENHLVSRDLIRMTERTLTSKTINLVIKE